MVRRVPRSALGGACALVLLAACGNEYHPDYHPDVRYAYSQSINAPTTVFNSDSQTPEHALPANDGSPGGNPSRVLVLETKHLDRPAEVVGVVDAHEEMGKHEAALWALKTKAARLGADAVVGVEFHHGEGQGEPTHLSGLAVRFVRAVPYPVD
jgi:hypothetical protein